MSDNWFSINIHSKYSNELIFTGYFCINMLTNYIIKIFEEINGNIDFNNNIIFFEENIINKKIFAYNNLFYYDNIYKKEWFSFNYNGIAITSMNFYKDYNIFRLWSYNSNSNEGILYGYKINSENKCSEYIRIEIIYTILPFEKELLLN